MSKPKLAEKLNDSFNLNIKGSFVLSTKGVPSETPSTENKRARHLCYLALRAAVHLQWNLEVLEEKYRTVFVFVFCFNNLFIYGKTHAIYNTNVTYITNTAYNIKYLLLTEFKGCTVSYGPSFSPIDLWPKHEACVP